MSTKKSKHVHIVRDEKRSLLNWSIILILGFILFLSPFFKAIFNGYSFTFDRAILTFVTAVFVTGIFLAFALVQRPLEKLKIDALQVVIWLLPLMYLISMFSEPASSFFASQSVLLHMAYAIAFTLGLYLARSTFNRQLMLRLFLWSGALIIIFGLMNWFGDASLGGIFNWSNNTGDGRTYQDAVLIGPDGARLTSVFQYANSYAAYLIAMIVALLIIIVTASRAKYTFYYSLLLVPACLSLLLTLSRGGLLIFPVIILLTMPFLRWQRQLFLLFSLVVTGLLSLLVLNPVTTYGSQLQTQFSFSIAFKGWGILVLASIVTAAIISIVKSYFQDKIPFANRTHWKKISLDWIVPFGGTLVGALAFVALFSTNLFTTMLPDNIQTRIENINFQQNSVLERGTFYSDAWKVVKEYPLVGAGGGAWANLYEKYQNNPYISNQTHSYYLQVLLEVGFLGFIVLFVILAGVYYFFIRTYFRSAEETRIPYLIFFVIATSILVHSILDFNMSYVYVSFLVYFCLGGMLAIDRSPSFKWQSTIKQSTQKFLYPLLLVASCIVALIVTLNQLSANQTFRIAHVEATSGNQTLQHLMESVDSAIALSANPAFIDMKLQLLLSAYQQSQQSDYLQMVEQTLKTIKPKEPFYKPFIYRELQTNKLQGRYEQVSAILEAAIPNYSWDIQLYAELATSYFQAGLAELNKGSKDQAKTEWNKAKILLDHVNKKTSELEALSEYQYQGREFGLTADLAFPLGQIAFYEQDYNLALEYLSARLDPRYDDANDIEATLYYSAALNKIQNKDDSILQEMYSKLDEENLAHAKSKFEVLIQ
jgi:hypothetical protein